MKQLTHGIVELDNGLHYFAASAVWKAIRSQGLDMDQAAAIVGTLVKQALDAEAGVQKVNA